MRENDVVMTGAGIVSSIGVGAAAFAEGLFAGKSGISPVEGAAGPGLTGRLGGQIKALDAAAILGAKGLGFLDRNATLACAAATLALCDAGLMDPAVRARLDEREGGPDVGLVLGTAFGSVESIAAFNREAILDPLFVNPGDFPKTVINAPAGNVAIRCGLGGINATVASGPCSAVQAIKLAVDALRTGQADIVLAGGSEQFGEAAHLGFSKAGCLAAAPHGGEERPVPFDRRRNGWCLGEGAAILVLESRAHAARRGATVRGTVAGYGGAFEPDWASGAAVAAAVRGALRDAGRTASEVGLVLAGANGDRAGDRAEALGLRAALGEAARPPVSAIKSQLGECLGASGAMQLVAALAALERGLAPPTLHFEAGDPDLPEVGVSGEPRAHQAQLALVSAQSLDGSATCILVERGRGAGAP